MKVFLIFLLLPLKLFSQELAGVWTGTIYNDTTRKYIPYEIAITENKGKLSGYSHTVFTDENNRQETGVKSLKIKIKGDKILIEDDELIYNNYVTPPPKGVRQYSALQLTSGPDGKYLVGLFNTNRTKEYASLTGAINLKKKEKITETSLIPVLEELKLSNSLSFVQAEKEIKSLALNVPDKGKVTQPKQRDVVKLETKKDPVIIEKDENLIDINEDTVDYKVDVIENAEVSKLKKQKAEKIKTPQVVANKIVPIPEHQKQITTVQEKKPPVFQPKNDVVVTPVKEDKKMPLKPEQKITVVVPKPVLQQPKQSETTKVNTEIKKDVAIQPKGKEKITPPVSKPVQPIVQTGPMVSSEVLAKRKIETIRSVDVRSDSIMLTLYDNGIIDGDTVSIILNGRVIISKQRLTETALNKKIHIASEPGDSLQLIMFAENLGSIAPNTGLLIIQDGEERHEVRFSGDLQKNSAIILRRKK